MRKMFVCTLVCKISNYVWRHYVSAFCFRQKHDMAANAPIPKLVTGLFGGFAGACSVLGNTPLDVIKTRMQVRNRFLVTLL